MLQNSLKNYSLPALSFGAGFSACAFLLLICVCDTGHLSLAQEEPNEKVFPFELSVPRDTIVEPGGKIVLTGSVDDQSDSVYWMLEDGRVLQALDTQVLAPEEEDSIFYCILHARDSNGFFHQDTHRVWVARYGDYRIIFPNGGETLYVDDTVTVRLWPFNGRADILLSVNNSVGNRIPGFGGVVNPFVRDTVSFVVPAVYTQRERNSETGKFETVTRSTASDSCLLVIVDYVQADWIVESRNYFTIIDTTGNNPISSDSVIAYDHSAGRYGEPQQLLNLQPFAAKKPGFWKSAPDIEVLCVGSSRLDSLLKSILL